MHANVQAKRIDMDMPATSSLKSRVWLSLGALASGHGIGSIVRLAGNLITTRLLVPELFGIMAVFTVISTGLEMLSDVGIRQSVIRSANAGTDDFRKTAWTFQIGRSFCLFLACQVIAGLFWALQAYELMPAGTVYSESVLPLVISAGSFAVLLRGFQSINILYAERSVRFGKTVVYSLISQIAATGCVVIWALYDPSIRALVGGTIIGALISVVISHNVFPLKSLAVGWDREAGKELRHMARWLVLSSIFGSIARHGDTLLLGIFVTTAGLGYFSIANMLVAALAVGLTQIQAVWFAALSEIARTSDHRLKEVYYRIRLVQDPIVVAAYLFIATQGERIVGFLYDDRYIQIGTMFQILAIAILAQIYELQARMLIVAQKQDQFWKKTATEAVVTLTVNLFVLATMPIEFALVAIAVKPLWGLWLPFRELGRLGLIRPVYELAYVLIIAGAIGFTLWTI
jgi:O-antigen/teichoic acid export membrane protein